MTPDVPGRDIAKEALGSLQPLRVLYDFDGPRIFVTADPSGRLLLAYLWDEDDRFLHYLVVPTSESEEDNLRRGALSVRDALQKPWAWNVRLGPGWLVDSVRSIDLRDMPSDCLPRPGVMLLPSLQPLITLRMVGDAIKPGMIPGSVIRQAIGGTEQALKTLLDRIWEANPDQRPSEGARQLFDLPTQRFAFGSLEISFGRPCPDGQLHLGIGGSKEEGPDLGPLERAGEDLRTALQWVSQGTDDLSPLGADDDAKRTLLDAAKHLTPPKNGPAVRVEIGGTLFRKPTGVAFSLTPESRRKIDAGLRKLRSMPPAIVSGVGFIRALDLDKKSFRFHDDESGDVHNFVYDGDRFDEVLEAFTEGHKVQLAGQPLTRGGPAELALIRAVAEQD